jgi:lysophospholipase L1-like esterase
VADWAAPPGDALLAQPPVEQTFRIQVAPTRGGSVARFRLSNRFGHGPVTFGAATVGRQDPVASGPVIEDGSLRTLTFAGSGSVTIPKGEEVLSDPVRIRFDAFQVLLVSVHVVGSPGPPTQHAIAEQTTWQSPPLSGDHTSDDGSRGFLALPLPGVTPSLPENIPYLTGMDVRAPRRVASVVTFGDSITDGTQASFVPFLLTPTNVDRFQSYPEHLARRFLRRGLPFAVANAGLSGNMLLKDAFVPVFGPAGLSRLGVDALARAGATPVILLEGINDIGQGFASRDDLVAGYRAAVSAAHARGLRILLGTLTPQNGTLQPGYGAMGEPTRVAVNQWIRHQQVADGVIDFDRAVRDPDDPSRIRPAYDGGDHLHFSPAGYQAMAAAVPLSLLKRSGCS